MAKHFPVAHAYPVTTGGGNWDGTLSTATGYTMADALTMHYGTMTVPFWDFANRQIDYRVVPLSVLFDDDTDSTNADIMHLMVFLELTWREVVTSFKLANRWDYALVTGQFESTSGQDYFVEVENTKAIFTTVNDVGENIDYWWGTKDFAKFGLLRTSDNGVYHDQPHFFINSALQTVVLDRNTNYVELNWQPGVKALVTCYGELLPPSITYSSLFGSGSYPI